MRWSDTFIPTLKETPQEAEIRSHQLLLQAGLIRRLSAGLYTYLPLGLRALRKVERIVREEMDAAGALEVLMPAMQPAEIWETSGRLESMREVMFHCPDRQERAMVLGPTHEEVMSDLATREISSYRQLPVNFYQIQTKFRDEIRPRFGLMRSKEFLMKDAYSFDADWEGADTSYKAMYRAYERIFSRCGLETKVVEADTGAIGGQSSHEFMVLADSGEDGIVDCVDCDYAANLEKAESGDCPELVFDGFEKEPEEISTPGQRSIEEVSKFLGIEERQLIKTLIYLADGEPCAVLLPGDRDINEIKLARVLDAKSVEMADDASVAAATGAPTGFAGPVGLDIPVYADKRLRGCKGAASGANKEDMHLLHIDLDRDAQVRAYADLAFAVEGEPCPRCGGRLEEKRGIEVGHVFKLGTKYSESFGARFLDDQGEQQLAIMGCYGIGISRTLQALVEQSFDDDGIIWPLAIAPFAVEIVVVNAGDAETMAAAEEMAAELEAAGIEVLLDDRDERPGFKFKDADLIGMPLRINVGKRGLANGTVDFRERASGKSWDVAIAEVRSAVEDFVGGD